MQMMTNFKEGGDYNPLPWNDDGTPNVKVEL